MVNAATHDGSICSAQRHPLKELRREAPALGGRATMIVGWSISVPIHGRTGRHHGQLRELRKGDLAGDY
jgi:hypothetical protein